MLFGTLFQTTETSSDLGDALFGLLNKVMVKVTRSIFWKVKTSDMCMVQDFKIGQGGIGIGADIFFWGEGLEGAAPFYPNDFHR